MAAVPRGAAASLRGSFPIDVVIRDTAPPRADRSVDRAAVDAVLGGDADAFRVLVDREAATVVRACYRILGDPHEAEDAAQEAFVIAYRSLASWRGDGAFGAWLARIAVRVALRQVSRRRTVSWVDPVTGPDSATEGHAAADPATLAMHAEYSADLRAAVARLDDPYRETIALRFFAERSLAEIAAETGRPLGTVKTHLHRGLLRLRDALGEREADR
jgi:RNA polymerase sigma-70 factor, ECF subfamily